jgi:GTPase SAR1 family protein
MEIQLHFLSNDLTLFVIFTMAKEIRVVAIGNGSAGNTSFLTVLSGRKLPECLPYLVDSPTREIPSGRLIFDELEGQEDPGSLHPGSSLRNWRADVFLLCFGLNSMESFRDIEYWVREINCWPHARVILVGTKSDLRKTGDSGHVTDD